MKHSRILGCRFLLVPLLGLLTCYYSQAQSPSTKAQSCQVDIDPGTCTVTVRDCKTDKGDPLVDLGDTVTWNVLTPHTPHTIGFKPLLSFIRHTPFSASTISSGHPETVVGDSWCTNGFSCYYGYSLTRQGENKPCVDPGVRVVTPPSANVVLYVELVALVALVGLVSFAVWRSRARKRASSLK